LFTNIGLLPQFIRKNPMSCLQIAKCKHYRPPNGSLHCIHCGEEIN